MVATSGVDWSGRFEQYGCWLPVAVIAAAGVIVPWPGWGVIFALATRVSPLSIAKQ